MERGPNNPFEMGMRFRAKQNFHVTAKNRKKPMVILSGEVWYVCGLSKHTVTLDRNLSSYERTRVGRIHLELRTLLGIMVKLEQLSVKR